MLESPTDVRTGEILAALGGRAIVLVGMMGSGKSAIGYRLAARLGLPFVDADAEIVRAAAGMPIGEIFAKYGEAYFRDGERRVIMRLLNAGQMVLATGGGAFMDVRTRDRIAQRGVSIWLDADLKTLMKRVRRKNDRPLLHTENPEETLRVLLEARRPIYQLADIRVPSHDAPQDAMVDETLDALVTGLEKLQKTRPIAPDKEIARIMTHLYPHRAAGDATDAAHREIIKVGLEDRAYDIVIGANLIEEAGARIAALAPGAACAVITDENVARLHLAKLEKSLQDSGIRFSTIIVPAGESSKSLSVYGRVCDEVLAAKIERRDLVVAFGGGVVGDLAGFVAASVRRGSRFVQIPTTLLSQVDSSVGGKTGINSAYGKNLIGAFHQPALVLADVDVLRTLSPREFRAGYAEVVKYGLIGDARFFQWLEADAEAIFHSRAEQICAVAVSCETKANIVARDELEQGDRALLNLGHTFGHALEALMHYNSERLVHGEGVAIGMVCAMRFSQKLGFCAWDDVERVERHLVGVGLPTKINDIPGWSDDAEEILKSMYQDKKVEGGALTFILTHGIGEAFIAKGVDPQQVSAFLIEEHERT
ncbi:MAG: 3-dehydroquinate synthase [Methylocystis sp.]